MYTFLNNFQEGGRYYAKISGHQAELKREEKFVDQKVFSISNLQIYSLNLDDSVKNTERANFFNLGAVTVEVHTQLKNDLSNRKKIKDIRNYLPIQ